MKSVFTGLYIGCKSSEMTTRDVFLLENDLLLKPWEGSPVLGKQ